MERVRRVDGRTVLSPLRFHYDSESFALPVRLGLLNSAGTQDLIVHILARNQRYEVANYQNVTIPTNLLVSEAVRNEFGPFYSSLFDRLLERNPDHIVTEYSWDASSCDPCPTPALTPDELATLGADVVPGNPYGFMLTRLHYRYQRDHLGDDLVFRAAPPIIGGRGMPDHEGRMTEGGAQPSSTNQFQGRYVMLHSWEGPIECESPIRGRWGGPPADAPPAARQPQAATNIGFVAGGRNLSSYLAEDVPALAAPAGAPADPAPSQRSNTPPPAAAHGGGCASCSAAGSRSPGALGWSVMAALAGAFIIRRRR